MNQWEAIGQREAKRLKKAYGQEAALAAFKGIEMILRGWHQLAKDTGCEALEDHCVGSAKEAISFGEDKARAYLIDTFKSLSRITNAVVLGEEEEE